MTTCAEPAPPVRPRIDAHTRTHTRTHNHAHAHTRTHATPTGQFANVELWSGLTDPNREVCAKCSSGEVVRSDGGGCEPCAAGSVPDATGMLCDRVRTDIWPLVLAGVVLLALVMVASVLVKHRMRVAEDHALRKKEVCGMYFNADHTHTDADADTHPHIHARTYMCTHIHTHTDSGAQACLRWQHESRYTTHTDTQTHRCTRRRTHTCT